MELSKNNRFRTGSMVDIYHTPVYESYSINIESSGLTTDYYRLRVFFEDNLTIEQFGVGDLCALSFGVGVITSVNSDIEGNYVWLEFEKSVFTSNEDVMVYVGSEVQHALFFLASGRVEANYSVGSYKETVNQATYGYAKSVYNLQTDCEVILTPIRIVDEGVLNKILYSKGFVLKSCNDENYTPTQSWDTEFPIELSGTSIDPVYRRAYLKKRVLTSKSRKAKSTMVFKLIG